MNWLIGTSEWLKSPKELAREKAERDALDAKAASTNQPKQ
jgi:hypothetical protein